MMLDLQAAQVRKSSVVTCDSDDTGAHAYHPESHHSSTIFAGTVVQQVSLRVYVYVFVPFSLSVQAHMCDSSATPLQGCIDVIIHKHVQLLLLGPVCHVQDRCNTAVSRQMKGTTHNTAASTNMETTNTHMCVGVG